MNADEQQKSNDQIAEMIWHLEGKCKVYASYWDWPDKELKERGIVCDLLEAIEVSGEHHGIVSVRANRPDPPDCVGTKTNGELIC